MSSAGTHRTDRTSLVDSFFMMAQAAAKRSLCARSQVGAVITTIDHRVIATGYNGPPAGFIHHDQPCTSWCSRGQWSSTTAYDNCPSVHAEANALLASERQLRINGAIYVTTELCYGCAKLIANSGLSEVFVLMNQIEYERRNSYTAYELLSGCGIAVHQISQDMGE